MKQRIFKVLALCIVTMALWGCSDDADFQAPAFLHIDGVTVVPPAYVRTQTGELVGITDSGFTTSNIAGVHVLLHFKGGEKELDLGTFRLPFTIPVLPEGELDYLRIYPAIPQSGQMNRMPYYTYYKCISFDSISLVNGDTLNLGNLTTVYDTVTDFPLLFENFEPIGTNLKVDSVEWVRNDAAGARCGTGYGKVHLTPDKTYADFEVNMGRQYSGLDFYVPYAGSKVPLLYLEFDVRADVELQVKMKSSYTSGGNPEWREALRTYPTNGEWVHMYVNMGRIWDWFSNNHIFSIGFSALNVDGIEGDVCIDNLKLITTAKTQ